METVKKAGYDIVGSNGNGKTGFESAAAHVPAPTPESGVEEEVKLEREDTLTLLLLNEKLRNLEFQRQQVELQKQILNRENDDIARSLSAKYGVDLSQYVINTETGIAKKR